MRIFIIVFLAGFMLACGGNTSPDGQETSQQQGQQSNFEGAAQKIIANWGRLEQDVVAIQKKVIDAKEDWAGSYEEMQYPQSTIDQLPAEDQKKLTFIYGGAQKQGKDFDVIINEVNSWTTLWENQKTKFNRFKNRVDANEEISGEELGTLDYEISQSSAKVKAWNDKLNKMKAETVLLYNTVNGIIVKSELN